MKSSIVNISIVTFLVLFPWFNLLCQNNLFRNYSQPDSNCNSKLLVIPEDPEKLGLWKFAFVVSDKSKLRVIFETILHGKEILNYQPLSDSNSLKILFVKDKEVINDEIVYEITNQLVGNVDFNQKEYTSNKLYSFDIASLEKFKDSIKGLNFDIKTYSFKSRREFKNFITRNVVKKNFFAYEDITEDFDGKFDVFLPKTEVVFNASEGLELLKRYMKSVSKNEMNFVIRYVPAIGVINGYKYVVSTKEEIFRRVKLPQGKIGNWQDVRPEVIIYWLEK